MIFETIKKLCACFAVDGERDADDILSEYHPYIPISEERREVPDDCPEITTFVGTRGHVRLTPNGSDLPTFWNQHGELCVEEGGMVYKIVYS